MTASELFTEFQDAQQTRGEFAYFSLLFFVPGIGTLSRIDNYYDGEIQLARLEGAIKLNHQPIGIIGIPTRKGLQEHKPAYVKRFVHDDWATGYIDQAVETSLWMIKHNPDKRPRVP